MPGRYGTGRRAGKEMSMKITEKELLFLASIGAAYESEFCKDRKMSEKEKYFTELFEAITAAESFSDLIKNPT